MMSEKVTSEKVTFCPFFLFLTSFPGSSTHIWISHYFLSIFPVYDIFLHHFQVLAIIFGFSILFPFSICIHTKTDFFLPL
jgi:hypothetical protein